MENTDKETILGNRGFTEEQIKQIDDACLLIPDRATQRLIANPFLEPEEMQRLIVIACSHPGAAIDFFELTIKENEEISAEIFTMVQTQAREYLKEKFALVTGGIAFKTFEEMGKNQLAGHEKIDHVNGYCYGQLDQIWQGMENGVDVFYYAKTEYDPMQMCQMRMGLMAGIDVTRYADSTLDWKTMEAKRKELTGSRYSGFSSAFKRLDENKSSRTFTSTITPLPTLSDPTVEEMAR